MKKIEVADLRQINGGMSDQEAYNMGVAHGEKVAHWVTAFFTFLGLRSL